MSKDISLVVIMCTTGTTLSRYWVIGNDKQLGKYLKKYLGTSSKNYDTLGRKIIQKNADTIHRGYGTRIYYDNFDNVPTYGTVKNLKD